MSWSPNSWKIRLAKYMAYTVGQPFWNITKIIMFFLPHLYHQMGEQARVHVGCASTASTWAGVSGAHAGHSLRSSVHCPTPPLDPDDPRRHGAQNVRPTLRWPFHAQGNVFVVIFKKKKKQEKERRKQCMHYVVQLSYHDSSSGSSSSVHSSSVVSLSFEPLQTSPN